MRAARAALLAAALLLGAGRAPAEDAPPRRVASINLCTDQLLLDLAEPERIVGLSPYARDAARSFFAARVGALPVLSGTAEEILVLRPDLVLAGRFTRRETRDLLRAHGLRLEEFDPASSIAEVRAQIGRMARLLGAEGKGRERIEALDASLARLRAAAREGSLRVLPLSRRGWAPGRNTLMGDLLREAGLVNAAPEAAGAAGLRPDGLLTLEGVVALAPDAVLLSQAPRAEDQGSALLVHPALDRLFPPERRLLVPEVLTICGGPMLADAVDALAVGLRRLAPRPAR